MKRRPMKRKGRKPETAAAKRARREFTETVLEEPGCWVQSVIPHTCSGPRDAMHHVDKSWLKAHAAYTLRLTEAEVLACVWDTRNGSPGCRAGHDLYDSPFHKISYELLPQAVFDFCDDYECWVRLEKLHPKVMAA